MKKISLMLLGGLLFCCNANADLICVKQGAEVTKANKVQLPKFIKVIKGDKCPRRYVQLLDTTTFVGPQGEKGEKGDTGLGFYEVTSLPSGSLTGVVGGKDLAYVSLPVPAPFPILSAAFGDATACTGSAENPTAPAGVVCIYPVTGSEVKGAPMPVSAPYIPITDSTVCEEQNYTWYEGACIRNNDDGSTVTDSDACDAVHGTWDRSGRCIVGGSSMDNCIEESVNTWIEGYHCLDPQGQPVVGPMDQETCEGNQSGNHWVAFNDCVDPNGDPIDGVNTREACESEMKIEQVPEHCSITEYTDKYSDRGFKVTADGEFSAVWAYTAPVLM